VQNAADRSGEAREAGLLARKYRDEDRHVKCCTVCTAGQFDSRPNGRSALLKNFESSIIFPLCKEKNGWFIKILHARSPGR
jgi:hypothetical protein